MEINTTEFKAKCLKLIDEVAQTREPLIITKRGKPVAKVVPFEEETPTSHFGFMAGTIEITGDIISPIEEEWSALTGDEDEFYEGLNAADDKGDHGK